MNRKTHIVENALNQIVELIGQGYNTPDTLQSQMNITKRQIFRYLKLAVDKGILMKPVHGIYCIYNESIPCFNDFQSDMSLSKQHNKTDTETGTLTDTIQLVLKTAKIECSADDLNRIVRIMSTSTWMKITPQNVLDFVKETWDRFNNSMDKYEIRNGVAYFFGILKRVISSSVSEMKRAYLEFIGSLDENVEVTEEIEPLPEEWEPIKEVISDGADTHGLYKVNENDIVDVLRSLHKAKLNPSRTSQAVRHMITHDVRGFLYMIHNLQSVETVINCVQKNYSRLLSTISKQDVTHSPERDNRYGAFYELFPDS